MITLTKNTHTPLWLDLELRKDIDDYITLAYALENKFNVRVVSINNPSINELKLLNKTIEHFNSKAIVIISGEITTYEQGEDIHPSLLKHCNGYDNASYIYIDSYLLKAELTDILFFCGGSLTTLAMTLTVHSGTHINAYIQGGYAAESVVGKENVLKKFKGRDKVPSWNMNLDLNSTKYVIHAYNVTCHFISKNICHDAWVHKDDINDKDNFLNTTLRDYFALNKWPSKCMHDLLAFLTIFTDEIVTFKPVMISYEEDKRTRWYSIPQKESNKHISISLNKACFTSVIKTYSPL